MSEGVKLSSATAEEFASVLLTALVSLQDAPTQPSGVREAFGADHTGECFQNAVVAHTARVQAFVDEIDSLRYSSAQMVTAFAEADAKLASEAPPERSAPAPVYRHGSTANRG